MEANITNFSKGEISPLYYGRLDAEFYASSVKELTNMLITPSGSLNKRPGFKYSGTHRYMDYDVRKIPANIAGTLYLLELGDNYMRVHRDGSVIMDGTSPMNIPTDWPQAVIGELAWVDIDDVIFVVHPLVEPLMIKNNDGTDTGWTIEPFDWYSNDASVVTPPQIVSATELTGYIEIAHNVFSFKGTDVGQRLYLKTDTGKDGYFTIDEFVWEKTQEKEVVDAYGDPVTRVEVVTTGDPPESQEVEVLDPDGVLAMKTVTVTVPENKVIGTYTAETGADIVSTDTITYFAIQPQDMTTLRPGAIASIDSRLIFSGFEDDRRKIMGSVVNNPYEFRMGIDANLAYEFSLKDNFGSKINWIVGHRAVVIGTDEGIFTIGGAESITPTTAFRLIRQTSYKTKLNQPVRAGDFLVYVQQPGTQLRVLQYNYEQDTYFSPSISATAEHMFRNGIKQIAYQQTPVNVIYAVTNDGYLCAFVLDKSSGVAGWSRFKTDGKVNDIAVVSGTDGEDDVYISVRRVYDGNTYYHMEKLEYGRMDIFESAYYVDSGFEWTGDDLSCSNLTDGGVITFDSADPSFDSADPSVNDVITFLTDPTGCTGLAGNYFILASSNSTTEFVLSDISGNPISGIGNSTASFIVRETADSITTPDHYDDGVEVSVFTERGVYTSRVVSGGSVSIPNYCRLIRAGFPFTARIETLPVPFRIKNVKEVVEVGVMFFESHAGTLSDEDGDISSEFTMDDDIVLDQGADLFTGVKRMHFSGGQSKYGNIRIESNQPTPMNVMAITYEIAEK